MVSGDVCHCCLLIVHCFFAHSAAGSVHHSMLRVQASLECFPTLVGLRMSSHSTVIYPCRESTSTVWPTGTLLAWCAGSTDAGDGGAAGCGSRHQRHHDPLHLGFRLPRLPQLWRHLVSPLSVLYTPRPDLASPVLLSHQHNPTPVSFCKCRLALPSRRNWLLLPWIESASRLCNVCAYQQAERGTCDQLSPVCLSTVKPFSLNVSVHLLPQCILLFYWQFDKPDLRVCCLVQG